MSSSKKIKDFYTGDHVLFIGNGLNLISHTLTWESLLQKLTHKYDLKINFDKTKPFPLLFEEIVHNMRGEDYDLNLKNIKISIYDELIHYKPNEYHARIIQLPSTEIFTTNYDYNFERVLLPTFSGHNSPGNNRHYKYSFERKNLVKGKNIWHLHGELNNGFNGKGKDQYREQSIMIGFEHYADYLRKIHGQIKPDYKSLSDVLEQNERYWPTYFFTHDIHIFGFNFSVAEIHLWWLINFRAKLIKKKVSVMNKITIYYPSFDFTIFKSNIEMLTSFNVSAQPIIVADRPSNIAYRRFYDRLSDMLEKIINKG